MTTYTAIVNGKTTELTLDNDVRQVNGEPVSWDIHSLGEGRFHARKGNRGFNADIISIDRTTRTVELLVNGKKITVTLRDKIDLLLEKLGMNSASAGKLNHVKAPMPGLIIDLRVKPGDVVKPGDALLVLEAMKMENVIKSAGEGVVKQVKVKKGDSVEKNQVLLEF